jgi:hypothetical protein
MQVGSVENCCAHRKRLSDVLDKRAKILQLFGYMKTTTFQIRDSMNRAPFRLALLLIALACFVLSVTAQATCQQGCLANENTVLGDDALLNNTGDDNTAIGFNALFSNTTAEGNTAIGWEALASTTTGRFNTATGWAALLRNTGGSDTAIGAEALLDNSTGFGNTATGGAAMALNTTGNNNTATGLAALFSNIDGNNNTATGNSALSGFTSGSNNIALGALAGDNLNTGDNNIDIGNVGGSHESNTIRIGTQGTQTITFIAGVSDASVTGVPVVINGNGRLGVRPSSQRFKTEVKPMDKASEAILALKPVTFRYKDDLDPAGIAQFGLVAEEVEKVNSDLVARDDEGKPYTVRYEEVNAMLLNEFLKEHKKVQEQGATIARLKSAVAKQGATIAQQQTSFQSKFADQERQIAALTAGLRKVSAQIELSEAIPQTVLDNE